MSKPEGASRLVRKEISFAVYGAAGRMARMHKPFLDPIGLTFPQYLVMLELYTETPRTVGDLGNALGMDTGTITPLLKRLQASGMVSRMRDPEDERRVIVDLTPAGLSVQEEVWGVSDKIKTACQMTEENLIELRDTLHNFAHPAKA
jgi:MarR family transcriptional regulator, organic hydroperoxide resistance regulator